MVFVVVRASRLHRRPSAGCAALLAQQPQCRRDARTTTRQARQSISGTARNHESFTGADTMNVHRLLAAGLGVLSLALAPVARGADQDKDVRALAARIDQRIAAGWGADVKPAPIADDAEFFRRVHLDLAGRIPSVTQVRDFLEDDRPDKRRIWVDRILQADPD